MTTTTNTEMQERLTQVNLLDRIILIIALRFGGANAKELERFLKFAIVGTFGAVVDFATLNILQSSLLPPAGSHEQLNVRLATGVAFTAAVTSNFIWNRYWTYPDSRSRSIMLQLGQFFAVNVVGLIFRLIFVGFLYAPLGTLAYDIIGGTPTDEALNQLGSNISQAIAVIIVMFWNFFVNRYWTYNDVD